MIAEWKGHTSREIQYTGVESRCLTLPPGKIRLAMEQCERDPNSQQWWITLPW
jgi:hypothetical protein